MSSSYFESLGRQESAPYTMEELNYAETEPDLVTAVNEQIEENIKDRAQFFTDNIRAYNDTLKASSSRLSDLAVLTQKGAAIKKQLDKYRKWDKEYERLEKISKNENERARFISEDQKVDNANADLQVESAHAVGDAVSTGKTDGENISLTDIADFEKNIVADPYTNGNLAISDAVKHLPQYMKIGFKEFVYKDKFYNELSYPDQQRWRQLLFARYIQMWSEEHPNISTRQIIRKLMPVILGEDKRLDGEAAITHVDTARKTVSDTRITGYITNILAAHENKDNGQGAPIDGIFTRNSIIQIYEAEAIGLKLPNAMTYANDKFVDEVMIPNIKQFNSQQLDWFLNEYEFKAKDGSLTTYAKLQPKRAAKIEAAWKSEAKKDHNLVLENRLNLLSKWVAEDGYKVQEGDISIFVGTDFEQAAFNLKNKSNLSILELPENKQHLIQINKELDRRSRDVELFGDGVTDPAYSDSVYKHMKLKTDQRLAELLKKFDGQENAVGLAVEKLMEEIRGKDGEPGAFDNVPPPSYDKTLKENIIASSKLYAKNQEATLNSTTVHASEEPYITNIVDHFNKKTKLSNFWYKSAEFVDNRGGQKLAYDRLKALGKLDLIGGPIPEFETVIDLGNLTTSRLLTNKTNESKILQAVYSSDKNKNWMLNRIIDPEVYDNGGVNAIKASDGTYIQPTIDGVEGEFKLEELTVGDILEGIANGTYDQETQFGVFSIRGQGLQELYNNGLISLDATLDKDFQVDVIEQRLRFKTNNKLRFHSADGSYRRLMNIPKKDRERLKEIIGDLGPYLDPNNLSAAALREHVEYNA